MFYCKTVEIEKEYSHRCQCLQLLFHANVVSLLVPALLIVFVFRLFLPLLIAFELAYIASNIGYIF